MTNKEKLEQAVNQLKEVLNDLSTSSEPTDCISEGLVMAAKLNLQAALDYDL